MMKKIFFAVSILLLVTMIIPFAMHRFTVAEALRPESTEESFRAYDGEEETEIQPDEAAFSVSSERKDELKTEAKSAYLTEYESGTVLFARNENARLPIASMTKIMLLNLCFEKTECGELSFEEKICVSDRASGMGGSQVFLEAGGEYSVDDLIKSVVVASANDASVALAEKMYGSEESCVDVMNEKCREWGLENTSFRNCTGLPATEHFSSAKDVSVMLTKLISHKDYFRYSIIWTDEIRHAKGNVTGLTNTNKLSRFYAGCDGGKTGYTSDAGFCLAATAKRGTMRVVAVVIGENNSKKRFGDVSTMFDYAFGHFTNHAVIEAGKPLGQTVEVAKGKCGTVGTVAEKDFFVFGKRGEGGEIEVRFEGEKIVAPVRKGQVVGKLIVTKNNVPVGKVNVLADRDVGAKKFIDYLKDVASGWMI